MTLPQFTETPVSGNESLDSLFDCLASSERRRILGILDERAPNSVPRRDLAKHLVQSKHSDAAAQDPDEAVKRASLELHHTHLPKLDAAGLIDQDTGRETVTISDHPAYEDDGIDAVIDPSSTGDPSSLDGLFRSLADDRRRTILDVLTHQVGPIHVETLARELCAKEQSIAESEVPADEVEEIHGSLRHRHLPRLADAGLVDYDPEGETVGYEGHPQIRISWLHSVLQPAFRQSITGELEPTGIGEVEGREQVISLGQSLFYRADEELFLLFTDTQLLEAGCLVGIRDAVRDRDVDVYLGTRDPVVREYVSDNAPEVVLWEPNTDWLSLPVAEDRVGRLVLADREAVMLGTLLDDQVGGVHEEQAIVGEDEHNTLVTMILQLLGPHLEAIDEDTDDISLRLPV